MPLEGRNVTWPYGRGICSSFVSRPMSRSAQSSTLVRLHLQWNEDKIL